MTNWFVSITDGDPLTSVMTSAGLQHLLVSRRTFSKRCLNFMREEAGACSHNQNAAWQKAGQYEGRTRDLGVNKQQLLY